MHPSVRTDALGYSSMLSGYLISPDKDASYSFMLGGYLISPDKDASEYSFMLGGHLIPPGTRAVKIVK